VKSTSCQGEAIEDLAAKSEALEREMTMRNRLKSYSLGACLFVFLFVVVGAGLHLNPMGAFVAALSGTPLVIHAANRWSGVRRGAATRTETQVVRRQGRFAVTEAANDVGSPEDLASRAS
jgi:hypothetical protein